MSDSNIKKENKFSQNDQPTESAKIPLKHKMQVKDLVHPITISRIRIIQLAVVGFIAIGAISYYYIYYLKQPTGLELVQNWIEASGGMEAWNPIERGSFQREHVLYAENGDVLKSKTESFYFEKINGTFKLLTNYVTPEGLNLWMGQDDVGYWATLNDSPTDPKKAAKDLGFMCDSKWCQPDCSMKMTLYRFGMPFNLIGDGVIPSLSGTTSINGQPTNILEVTYRPTVGKDRWVFYADQENNLINKIEYHHKNDHGHNFPEEMYWSDYKSVAGLIIPHTWKRYWTNGKVLEKYTFSNFSFNKPLPNQFANRPI